ncbi:hypothetical protein GF407_20045 [candidate division KSB1 bacterium]|nr:hypothetical protein [candidate division KSB1 bacterium]
MKNRILLVIGILVITSFAMADSFYSSLGLGLPKYFISTKSAGMGGVGLAIADPLSLNSINPAAFYIDGVTTVSLDFQVESADIKNTQSKVNMRDGNAVGFHFVFPLHKSITFLSSLTPKVISRYHLSSQQELDDIEFLKKVNGNGGLSSANLGLQYSQGRKLLIAAQMNYYFGSHNENWKTVFLTDGYVDGEDEITSHFWGVGFSIGMLARPLNNLSIGMVYYSTSNIDVETSMTLSSFYQPSVSRTKLDYPSSFGFGLGYQIKKLLVGLDYYNQQWSQYSVENGESSQLNNYWRVGSGIEYQDAKATNVRYLRRVIYRIGAYYAKLPFSNSENESVSEQFVTVGLGLPFLRNRGRVDLALEYGKRGVLEHDPYQENLFRISCSITGGELWFQRRPR